jgi:2-dehydro-3-deoxyglucarate aldolase|tara:strand:+ start:53 stop:742 length:690 start_codon:yes stop_codon:yes gene_type:complete
MRLSWQQIPSTIISDILSQNQLDGVVIDTEHGGFNTETLGACIQVVTLNKKKCFVRLTEINKTLIRICLDMGCDGLIFSTIETKEASESIRDMCIYPKNGGKRGLGLVRENLWGMKDLVKKSDPVLIAQIETSKGVDNIKEILDTNVFNFYMIGPYDLSASVGIPGDFENKNYQESVSRVRKYIPDKKMAVHIPVNVKNEKKKYENYGIIAMGMDTTSIIKHYKEIEDA